MLVINNVPIGIKKGIIDKSSRMITTSSIRGRGISKRRSSQEVNISLIQKDYMECWQTPETCEAFFSGKMSGSDQKETMLPSNKIYKRKH
jgi:hypothetical protein